MLRDLAGADGVVASSSPQRQPSPAWLRTHEQDRLTVQVAEATRAIAVYTLALQLGLACREIVGLEVRDLSLDGRTLVDNVICRVVDRRSADHEPRSVPLPPALKPILARYLSWRRSLCPHPERPMKTIMGRDRIRRCASCGDVADFLQAPLFLSQWMRRISPRRLRAEFAEYRDAAGLRKSLHFDCMRATFLHEQQSR